MLIHKITFNAFGKVCHETFVNKDFMYIHLALMDIDKGYIVSAIEETETKEPVFLPLNVLNTLERNTKEPIPVHLQWAFIPEQQNFEVYKPE